jgi:hypothetical protein
MTPEDKDLNIDNYNYPEILGIFNVGREFKQSIIDDIENKIKKIKQKLTYDYYLFYFKGYKIIYIIHDLYKKNIIQDENNINYIEYYVNNIKRIDSFEHYDLDKIYELLNINIQSKEKMTGKEKENGFERKVSEVLQNQVVNSFPYPVAPTNLNTIKRITHFKNINLNSCFRSNYSCTNACDFQFLVGDIKNVVSMRLASIELPNSWYLYSEYNKSNFFKINIKTTDIDTEAGFTLTTYIIRIPDGNYDIDTLPTYLNNTYFYNSSRTDELKQLSFTIDDTSFKGTFSVINGNLNNLSFEFVFCDDPTMNIMNTFGWMIGFRQLIYKNVGSSIVTEGMFDGGGDRYIYVAINDYQNNNNPLNAVCFNDGIIIEEDIIGKIPIVNGKFAIVISENNTLVKTRKYNGPVNIRNLHIKIFDKFGEVINLNNMDYSITLEFEILYEKFSFKDL